MTAWGAVAVVLLILVLLVVGSVWRYAGLLVGPADESAEGPTPELVALLEIAASLRGRGVRRGEPLEIRLMSGSLTRELGRLTVEAGRREPTVRLRTAEGEWSVCVASHQEGAAWVYRRVGVERGA